MRLLIKFFVLAIFLTGIISCGQDKLSPKQTSTQSDLLSYQACNCNTSFSPVCGNDGNDYNNTCMAQCFGTTVKNVGHCNCEASSTLVCSGGLNYTECEANAQNIVISKFVPCASPEI